MEKGEAWMRMGKGVWDEGDEFATQDKEVRGRMEWDEGEQNAG